MEANASSAGQGILTIASTAHSVVLTCLGCVQTDKKYQLADWRIRPLPEEMALYARLDTHHLLHIHDLMKVGRLLPLLMSLSRTVAQLSAYELRRVSRLQLVRKHGL